MYSPQDYPTTFDFLKRAYGIGLPLTKLISHRFKLDEITEALETNVQMKGIKIAVICDLSFPCTSPPLPGCRTEEYGSLFCPLNGTVLSCAGAVFLRLIVILRKRVFPVQELAFVRRSVHQLFQFRNQRIQFVFSHIFFFPKITGLISIGVTAQGINSPEGTIGIQPGLHGKLDKLPALP